MNLEEAQQLQSTIQALLVGYKAYCKIAPGSRGFRVIVVQQGATLPDLPKGVKIIPGTKFEQPEATGAHMSLEPPQSSANRSVEPSDEFRWRSREIQDIVKRIATMKNIVEGIKVLAGRRSPRVDVLLESLQKDLMLAGVKPTHPLVKSVNRVQRGYKTEAAEALVTALKAKYPEPSDMVNKAKQILKLVEHLDDIDPQAVNQAALAKETAAILLEAGKLCGKLVSNARKLGLDEEAHQLKAMAAAAKDIHKAVSKLVR